MRFRDLPQADSKLYDTTHATQNLTPSTQASAKRRRIDNAISTLVANIDAGSTASRILHVQILTFFIDRYQARLHSEAQRDIRRALIDLLDQEDANLQSWAMIAFSHLAIVGDEPSHSSSSTYGLSGLVSRREETPWNRLWAHATRKIAIAALSRAACHTATCLLRCGLANSLGQH
jgi:ataxia telangiectasia mutated family protein